MLFENFSYSSVHNYRGKCEFAYQYYQVLMSQALVALQLYSTVKLLESEYLLLRILPYIVLACALMTLLFFIWVYVIMPVFQVLKTAIKWAINHF